jgi:endo-1,4-beta-xylanase
MDNDGGTGVKQVTYSTGGAQSIAQTVVSGASASFTISVEGVTTVTFFGTDNAGSSEAPQTVTIKLDKTAPRITSSFGRARRTGGIHAPLRLEQRTRHRRRHPGLDDWNPSTTGQLRAQRSGQGNGRIYTLTYRGNDQAGNSATCATTVIVAHDESNNH